LPRTIEERLGLIYEDSFSIIVTGSGKKYEQVMELQREAKYKEILCCETWFVVQEAVSYTANNNSFSDQAYLDVHHVLLFAWFMDLD